MYIFSANVINNVNDIGQVIGLGLKDAQTKNIKDMTTITIPANQQVNKDDYMRIHLTNGVNTTTIYIKSDNNTSSASYDEVFLASEFNRDVHGFRGINNTLVELVKLMK